MAYLDSLDVDKVLLKWLRVLEEFCQRYDRLNYLIQSTNNSISRKSARQTEKLGKLLVLREHISHTMATLLMDMSPRPTHSTYTSPPTTYIKLQVHISLLDELTRKIDAELTPAASVTQV